MSTRSPDSYNILHSICATHSISSICKGWTWCCQRPETTPGSCNRFPWPCPYRPNDQRSWTCLNQMDVADVAQEAQEHLMPYFSTQHKYLRYLAIVFQIFWPWGDCQCNDSILWWNVMNCETAAVCSVPDSALVSAWARCWHQHKPPRRSWHPWGRGGPWHAPTLRISRIRYSNRQSTKHQSTWSSMKQQACQILPNLAKFLPNSCQILAKFRRIALRLAWKWSWVASISRYKVDDMLEHMLYWSINTRSLLVNMQQAPWELINHEITWNNQGEKLVKPSPQHSWHVPKPQAHVSPNWSLCVCICTYIYTYIHTHDTHNIYIWYVILILLCVYIYIIIYIYNRLWHFIHLYPAQIIAIS